MGLSINDVTVLGGGVTKDFMTTVLVIKSVSIGEGCGVKHYLKLRGVINGRSLDKKPANQTDFKQQIQWLFFVVPNFVRAHRVG